MILEDIVEIVVSPGIFFNLKKPINKGITEIILFW